MENAGEYAREAPNGGNAVQTLLAELERQANSGDGRTACKVGDHYRVGDIVLQDQSLAFRWYKRGTELGDGEAQNNFGTMLLNAIGCDRSPEEAVHWYRKSAEQGLAVAQYNLAKRYLHGDGVEQDYLEAYKWFEKATLQGDSWAACEMGTMYWLGQGVERNLVAAADFHLLAAEAGDSLASRNISEYRQEVENLALSGNQLASLFLCKIYNRGFGADKSQSMTWAWISWAKNHCTHDTDAETAQTVSEAYDFYHMCISSENRKLGERSLAAMRKAQRKPANASGKAKPRSTHQRHSRRAR